MARVQHVKKAQQRFERVPVLDEDGRPKRTVTTVKGKEVTKRLTVADKTKPLPPEKCDFTGCDIDDGQILPGTAYQFLEVKTGPRSTKRYTRHEAHRSWYEWEYSSSLSARLAEIAHDFWSEVDSATSTDDVQSSLDSASDRIREISEEKSEAASNVEEGFGQSTSVSEELANIADELDSWADEVQTCDIPDQPSEFECPECAGTGTVEDEDGDEDCTECDGTGLVDEITEDGLDTWREEVVDACSIIDEPPV